jgi:pimeloyl-ACP methyl ester carboxylesterase
MRSLRATLTKLLGIPPLGAPTDGEFRGTLRLDGVVVEKWVFRAEVGSRIPANLYRPGFHGRPADSRTPAVVMTHGHGDSKGVAHQSFVAQTLAGAGIACLVADPLGEEERSADGDVGTREHDDPTVAYRSELVGRSVMGKLVFDAMRSIDFLESLPFIDSARIAVAGNSLGGAVATWLFALEPRLRATIVSGWAISDILATCVGKFCTRVPNRKLRALCDWSEFLSLASENNELLVMNGDADVVIDKDGSRTVWRDTDAHLRAADPSGTRMQSWFRAGGGHRPYQGTARALRFIHETLGTPALTSGEIDALEEMHFGSWCDERGVEIEPLYGTELHYRGALLPDLGQALIPRGRLAVLQPDEVGGDELTVDGWLSVCEERSFDSGAITRR